MERMTVRNIVEACGGTLLRGDPETKVEHISIDSRQMKGRDLFVPLIGERVDGHRFISQALGQGAAAVLTSRVEEAVPEAAGFSQKDQEKAWIRVADTRLALQDIGRFCRRRLNIPLVGVTGSVGKTTTRAMIAAALSAKYRVYQTPGNKNSQVGVPITLSEISGEDQIGVIELGMSEPGELTVIAQIAQIDMAVITNIGIAHIQQLGSQENICREKLTIQDGLKPGGTLFLNGDDQRLKVVSAKEGCLTIYYGTGENCQYRAEEVRMSEGCASFTAVCGEQKLPVALNVPGGHQVLNAMAALAVADQNGVPLAEAVKKLEEFHGVDGRLQIHQFPNFTVIDDTYNASPVSMRSAIDTLVSRSCQGRRIAVLADMKELGEERERLHREVGEYLGRLPVDLLITYGTLARHIREGALAVKPGLKAVHFDDKDQLESWLSREQKPGDCLLFKGSNSMKLGDTAKHVCQCYH